MLMMMIRTAVSLLDNIYLTTTLLSGDWALYELPRKWINAGNVTSLWLCLVISRVVCVGVCCWCCMPVTKTQNI